MNPQDEIEALRRQVEQLSSRLGQLEDVHAIRRLQHAYGYYLDKGLYQEVVDLFAQDGEVRFMGGTFKGKEQGVQRLYIGRFRSTFTHGRNGPVNGFLLDHLQLQDVIDVAPDRKTAKGRFRCFMQAGSHETKTDSAPRLPKQWWEAGVYENTYVSEDGTWKIKVLNYALAWQANFEDGWRHSKPYDGPFFTKTYPEDPIGPDQIDAQTPPFWPQTGVVSFHYPHPVTGEWWQESTR